MLHKHHEDPLMLRKVSDLKYTINFSHHLSSGESARFTLCSECVKFVHTKIFACIQNSKVCVYFYVYTCILQYSDINIKPKRLFQSPFCIHFTSVLLETSK